MGEQEPEFSRVLLWFLSSGGFSLDETVVSSQSDCDESWLTETLGFAGNMIATFRSELWGQSV